MLRLVTTAALAGVGIALAIEYGSDHLPEALSTKTRDFRPYVAAAAATAALMLVSKYVGGPAATIKPAA